MVWSLLDFVDYDKSTFTIMETRNLNMCQGTDYLGANLRPHQ